MNGAIVIPVYNHERTVAGVVHQALGREIPVIVVDDGSTDRTGEILKIIDGITLLSHACNRGKGAAILTGCAQAEKMGCDYVVTIDADGQHDPDDAAVLLAAVGEGERCLVLGCRQGMAGENVPWTSSFGRKFSNFWVRVSGGPLVRDSQSGFRVYPVPEVQQLGVKARRYQFEVEVLVRARVTGLRVKEAPVSVVYQPPGERVSHFRPWQDFLRNSVTFSRLIWARIFRRMC